MTIRIAIASQKGGVGKTTVSLNLSLALAESGKRTLLVDLDPQGGIGHALAKGDEELVGLADVLTGAVEPAEAVLHTKVSTLSILPRGQLDPVSVCDFEAALFQSDALRRVLDTVAVGYDRVIIDTPSGIGMPTRAALRVSDFVLLPLQTEALALRSLSQMLQVLAHIREGENPKLELLGILPTMLDRTDESAQTVLFEVWGDVEGILETVIPRHEIFARASLTGLPLAFLAGRPTPEARRFELLAREIEAMLENRNEVKTDDERPQRSLL